MIPNSSNNGIVIGEVCDLNDLEALARMLVAAVGRIDAEFHRRQKVASPPGTQVDRRILDLICQICALKTRGETVCSRPA